METSEDMSLPAITICLMRVAIWSLKIFKFLKAHPQRWILNMTVSHNILILQILQTIICYLFIVNHSDLSHSVYDVHELQKKNVLDYCDSDYLFTWIQLTVCAGVTKSSDLYSCNHVLYNRYNKMFVLNFGFLLYIQTETTQVNKTTWLAT